MAELHPLREERDRRYALVAVQRAPLGMEVRIGKPKRTSDQNRRLFSMLQAIVDAKKPLAGRERGVFDWYEALWSAFLTEKRLETGTQVVGLAGELLTIGRLRASESDTALFGEWMDSVDAWMANNGVHWEERTPPPPPESDGR